MSETFDPTPEAAQARLAAVKPSAYAETRNHLEGAVTRLSPYISRGFLALPEVLDAVQARSPMPAGHKFIQELAWREYFHHVWKHRGNGILESLHAGPKAESAYARTLPPEFLQACTGVRAIDRSVQALTERGWLHNHARLWLAGWLVHEANVHWKTGADWMFGHLIDGDLASNHLSWQWVSGTGSHKPYLFTEGNVARFAPRDWHGRWKAPPVDPSKVLPPLLADTPPAEFRFQPVPMPAQAGLAGAAVWIAHPGSLRTPPADFNGRVVSVLPTDDLGQRPWGRVRWQFICSRLRQLAGSEGPCWIGSGVQLASALRSAASVDGQDDPHLPPPLRSLRLRPQKRILAEPAGRCDSFSRFWRQVGPDRQG